MAEGRECLAVQAEDEGEDVHDLIGNKSVPWFSVESNGYLDRQLPPRLSQRRMDKDTHQHYNRRLLVQRV